MPVENYYAGIKIEISPKFNETAFDFNARCQDTEYFIQKKLKEILYQLQTENIIIKFTQSAADEKEFFVDLNISDSARAIVFSDEISFRLHTLKLHFKTPSSI